MLITQLKTKKIKFKQFLHERRVFDVLNYALLIWQRLHDDETHTILLLKLKKRKKRDAAKD